MQTKPQRISSCNQIYVGTASRRLRHICSVRYRHVLILSRLLYSCAFSNTFVPKAPLRTRNVIQFVPHLMYAATKVCTQYIPKNENIADLSLTLHSSIFQLHKPLKYETCLPGEKGLTGQPTALRAQNDTLRLVPCRLGWRRS